MTEQEYKEFLEYIFIDYVGDRIRRVEEFFDHPKYRLRDYELHALKKASILIRYITAYGDDSGDIYRTFTAEAIRDTVQYVESGVRKNNRLLRQSGIMDALDAFLEEIIDGVELEHFPEYDLEVLRELGSTNPRVELQGLILAAKVRKNKRVPYRQEVSVSKQLERVEEELSSIRKQFESAAEKNPNSLEPPKKSRRWWKGLGQICTGAAISIADVGLAVGVLHYPVSPETQTWGALMSTSTGVCTVFNGAGELRGE